MEPSKTDRIFREKSLIDDIPASPKAIINSIKSTYQVVEFDGEMYVKFSEFSKILKENESLVLQRDQILAHNTNLKNENEKLQTKTSNSPQNTVDPKPIYKPKVRDIFTNCKFLAKNLQIKNIPKLIFSNHH